MRKIDKIIIHCSATPEGRDYTVADIDAWHRARKFDCIGYHFVIYRDGSVHAGRPIEKQGAHCLGQNPNSIGICYIGGCAADGCEAHSQSGYAKPKDTRTSAQRAALIELVKKLREQFPGATVHGHNEFANKACPSFNVQKEPKLCGYSKS